MEKNLHKTPRFFKNNESRIVFAILLEHPLIDSFLQEVGYRKGTLVFMTGGICKMEIMIHKQNTPLSWHEIRETLEKFTTTIAPHERKILLIPSEYTRKHS